MSHIAEAIFYTKDNQWISVHDNEAALFGITDYALERLATLNSYF